MEHGGGGGRNNPRNNSRQVFVNFMCGHPQQIPIEQTSFFALTPTHMAPADIDPGDGVQYVHIVVEK